MGRAHSLADPEKVRKCVKEWNCENDFREHPKYKHWYNCGQKVLQQHFPDIIEEIKGIADGCDLPFKTVLSHNLYTLLRTNKANEDMEECSGIGFAQTSQGAIFGKNNDAGGGDEFTVIIERKPQGKYSFVEYTYSGMAISVAGINSVGFAIGGASGGPAVKHQLPDTAIASMMMVRKWLETAETVDEALEQAHKVTIEGCVHYMIADAQNTDKSLCHIEWVADEIVEHWPQNGNPLYFANRLIDEDFAKKWQDFDINPKIIKNSTDRYECIKNLYPNLPRNVDSLKTILSFDEGKGRICQSVDIDGCLMNTDLSSIFIPQTRTALISHGPPNRNEYKTYSVLPSLSTL